MVECSCSPRGGRVVARITRSRGRNVAWRLAGDLDAVMAGSTGAGLDSNV